ncbi:hypothetical protein CXB49_20700 [Chromobacterium sp. ATCC 53434]|uniref:BPSS1780 family membrane protein n=1 Tax=Chromobacterium sp. (strain ATCC 53434 / SC 14030) TaxID=2059672 RepID=UPI000C787FB3|nr:BPSS1780 family membrane protein [Chromobacterium sp. ATCC 53434]AUH53036.1 hypothetical protein CXB49_20700 [Chromobacterium sp. ATCC 53434]
MQSPDTVHPPRKIAAGRGWRWCVEAFHIVREQPLTWVLLTLVYLLIGFAVSLVPVLGRFAGALIGPLFGAGYVLAAHKSVSGGELELADLFEGFRRAPGPLILVGVIYFALALASVLVITIGGVAAGAGGGLLSQPAAEAGQHAAAASGTVGVLLLVMAVVMFVVSLCYWFAPALVVLNGVSAWQAIRGSLSAGLANWRPLLVAALALGLLLIPALLPLGLGLLLWIPVAFVTAYTSWRDVFGQPEAPAPVEAPAQL